jgi:ribosomal protein S18 acetylase RimI-like enzyme
MTTTPHVTINAPRDATVAAGARSFIVVRQLDPTDSAQVRRFITLESDLLDQNPLYVPPLKADLERRLSGRSAFWDGMEHALFVAQSGGKDVARCAAMISRRYQAFRAEAVGFIGFFAAAESAGDAVLALTGHAEAWLAARSVTRVIAPYNGAALIGMGIWTGAFDEAPMFPYNWNPPSYGGYFELAGYRPSKPLWVFTVDFSTPEYRSMSKNALTHASCNVRPISRLHWDRDIHKLQRLFNGGFMDEWEFMPYTLQEFHESFDAMRLVDPHLILFAEVAGEAAGFCVGFGDWNPFQRTVNGRFGPREMIRVLHEGGSYTRAGLIMIAILPEYRGRRIGQTLTAALFRYWEARGLPGALYYVVNDSNIASRRLAESFGGRGRILQHVFDKVLVVSGPQNAQGARRNTSS